MKLILLRLSLLLIGLGALIGLTKPAHATDAIAVNFDLPTATAIATPTPSVPDAPASPPIAPSSSQPPLAFEPAAAPVTVAPPAPAAPTPAVNPPPLDQASLFAGGSDSLVARAVGHAEGTRTADGRKTSAYYGHTDPGNRVWNIGSFSFQHCGEASYSCTSPDEADRHQLRRLKTQAEAIRQRAAATGVPLSLEAELNGIDLANQAPAAALGQPGYVEWLDKAEERGLKGEEAVLWARVSSYWDPQRQGWNAPGLGNSETTITHDQNRRMTAISRVLESDPDLVAQIQTLYAKVSGQ
ncbi:MAG: hypothetical protein ACKO24_09795 [Leptolyngbyaceae cyanobacterium]